MSTTEIGMKNSKKLQLILQLSPKLLMGTIVFVCILNSIIDYFTIQVFNSTFVTNGLEFVPLKELFWIGLLLVLKSVVMLFLLLLVRKYASHLHEKLSNRLLDQYWAQGYSVFKSNTSGKNYQAMLEGIQIFIENTLIPSILILSEVFALIAIMFALVQINPILMTILIIVLVVFIVAIVKPLSFRIHKFGLSALKNTQEFYDAYENAKIFGREAYSYGKMEFLLNNMRNLIHSRVRNRLKAYVVIQLPRYIFEPLVLIIFGISFLISSFFQSNTSNFATFITFSFAAVRALPYVYRVMNFYNAMTFGSVQSREALSVIQQAFDISLRGSRESESERLSHDHVMKLTRPISGPIGIRIEHLSFSYPKQNSMFEDLSVTFQPGSFNLILGENGAGKSTFLDLIAGLHHDNNAISFFSDEYNIESRERIQQSLAYVSQDAVPARISVAEFLNPFSDTYESESVSQVLAKVGFSEQQFDDSAHASELSGGQIQKLRIARALLRQPRLLLVDEGSTFLDKESIQSLKEILFSISSSCTVLLVSHELSFKDISTHAYKLHDKRIVRV